MKQLLSLTCLGVFCLLLSSAPANAQVSRKGDQGSTKVILKKDKNEPVDARSDQPETSSSRQKDPTQGRTGTDTRTYPDRQQQPGTGTGRSYPENTDRYPRQDRGRSSDNDHQTHRRGDYDGHHGQYGNDNYHKDSHGKGKNKKHHDHSCRHPGKGKHLGWHK